MRSNEFVEYIIGDQLAALPGMSARAMFGGFGIYREGTIVSIVVDDELYLKVDDTTQAKYTLMGSSPFCYARKDGKKATMSYWKVPAEVLEDRERLITLVEESYDINLKKSAMKRSIRKKTALRQR